MTLDKLIEQGVFDKALVAITTDKINSMSLGSFETFGNRVRNIALEINSKCEIDSYKTLNNNLTTKVYSLMTRRKNLTQETEKQILFKELNTYQLDKKNHKIFK